MFVVSKRASSGPIVDGWSFFDAFLLAMRLMFVRSVFFVASSRGLPVALLYMTGN